MKFSPLEAMNTGTIHRKLLLCLMAMCGSKELQPKHSRAGQRRRTVPPGVRASPALEEEGAAWGAGVGSSLGKGNREYPSAAQGPWEVNSQVSPVSKVFTEARVVFSLGRRGLRKERVKGAMWTGGQGPLLCCSFVCEVGRL